MGLTPHWTMPSPWCIRRKLSKPPASSPRFPLDVTAVWAQSSRDVSTQTPCSCGSPKRQTNWRRQPPRRSNQRQTRRPIRAINLDPETSYDDMTFQGRRRYLKDLRALYLTMSEATDNQASIFSACGGRIQIRLAPKEGPYAHATFDMEVVSVPNPQHPANC